MTRHQVAGQVSKNALLAWKHIFARMFPKTFEGGRESKRA